TWGVIDGEALRPASESALQKIVNLIEEAQHFKAPSQRFSDRFGTGYTYLVLLACTAFFLVGWLLLGWPPFLRSHDLTSAFYRAMTLLVVMSPCALVRIDTYVGDEAAVLSAAYNLARLSHHPLSRAIQKLGMQRDLPILEFTQAESQTGGGLTARSKGRLYALGSAKFVHAKIGHECESTVSEHDVAEVWVGGPDLCGRLLLRDKLRPEAKALIDRLHGLGMRIVMLTGDRSATAKLIASEAGVEDVRAELSPESKVAAVQELKSAGGKVAMIGDGVNDAPVLAAADVGVAMGARGSDAAMEQAEVVLMKDRLENFAVAYQLSRRAKAIIGQNITIALGTVIVMALLALVRSIPLSLGVFAHEGSTFVVVLNSLRLLFVKLDR
ncbi:MAG: heavy metal translocating P-type ATPase, partial [Chthoniobacterales bacterium]